MNAADIAAKHNASLGEPKPAGVGHNSGGRVRPDELKSFVSRVVALEEEKQTFADDIKDVLAEARQKGLDPKTIRRVVKLKMADTERKAKIAEAEAMFEAYKLALGMLE